MSRKLTKSLKRKLAYMIASGGSTCDTGDVIDILRHSDIYVSVDEGNEIAEMGAEIYEKLYRYAEGWEKAKGYRSPEDTE